MRFAGSRRADDLSTLLSLGDRTEAGWSAGSSARPDQGYWASFAQAEAAFAKVEREATNRSYAIRENEEAVEKPAFIG
jgi:hypothetical protein